MSMRQAGLRPPSDTFTIFFTGYDDLLLHVLCVLKQKSISKARVLTVRATSD